MGKYICSVCGYVYDEAAGVPETGVAPGTLWKDLPEDWVCPLCGAAKSEFQKQEEAAGAAVKKTVSITKPVSDLKEMTSLEMSALCTNLARGCEKQYKHEEASLFNELGNYFKAASAAVQNPGFSQLLVLIENDLAEGIPYAQAAASEVKDRGALRSLVWCEKVTRILKSLLTRYENEKDAMLENTGVFVCTICGFIYVGDTPPEVCPVCKVPNWKFAKVEGRS